MNKKYVPKRKKLNLIVQKNCLITWGLKDIVY